jgi:hypothetical protein
MEIRIILANQFILYAPFLTPIEFFGIQILPKTAAISTGSIFPEV